MNDSASTLSSTTACLSGVLKRNLIANYIGQGWTALMGLAFVPFYIQYLGIDAYGLIGLFALLQAWLALLDMGMTPTLGREMSRYTGGGHSTGSIRNLLRSIEILAAGIAILIAAGVAFGSHWFAVVWLKADTLPNDTVIEALIVMGLVTALRFVEGVYRSAIVGLQRQVLFNVINSLMATLRAVGAIGVLIWISASVQAFFVWQALVSITSLGILVVATYANLPPTKNNARFSIDALRGVWRFAGGMIGITFLTLLLTQVDKMLLSKLLSLTDFGYYTLAATVAAALYVLITPITQAWYPKLCELYARDDHATLTEMFHQGAQLVTVIAGSAAVVMILFSETFLRLWTQDATLAERTAPLLSLLMLGNLLNGLMWIPYQTQLAHGWTGLTVRINIVAVALIVPAILWATPRYGAEGEAWAWVALNLGYVLIGVHLMYRRILKTEKWRWYAADVMAPLLGPILGSGALSLLPHPPANIIADAMLFTIAVIISISTAFLAVNQVRRRLRARLVPVQPKD